MRYFPLFWLLLLGGSAQAQNFTLSSPVGGQATDQEVFDGFGCTGKNLSPALHWKDAPAGTKSFAITMYDPDAPTGSGWWHWVVYDIPANVTDLVQGAGTPGHTGLPATAQQGRTDFGSAGYGGPCPPPGHGPHRYIITIYALSVDKLDVPAGAGAPMVGFNVGAKALGRASIVLYYGR